MDKIIIRCIGCGTEVEVISYPNRPRKYCSRKCHNATLYKTTVTDYRVLTIDGERVKEHRHVMEVHLGRKLRSNEHVHHKNQDIHDNRLDNLEVMSISEHLRTHAIGRLLSPEIRVKISSAHTGKKLSPDHAAKIRMNNLGKKFSIETRKKMSISAKAREQQKRTQLFNLPT